MSPRIWPFVLVLCSLGCVAGYAEEDVLSQAKDVLRIAVKAHRGQLVSAQQVVDDYERLSQGDAFDSRLEFCYGLTLVSLRRHSEAGEALSRAAFGVPDPLSLSAHCAEAWSLASQKRHAPALERLRHVGELVAKLHQPPDRISAVERAVDVSGSLFGFMAGPSKQFRVASLEAAKDDFLKKLDPELADRFRDAEAAVLKRHAELETELDLTRHEDEEREAERREQAAENLEESKERAERELAELADDSADARRQLAAKRDQLNQDRAMDANRAQRLQLELNQIRVDMQRIQDLINLHVRRVRGPDGRIREQVIDPIEMRRLVNELNRLRRLSDSIVQELDLLVLRGDDRAFARGQVQDAEQQAAAAIERRRREIESKVRSIEKKQNRLPTASTAKPSTATATLSRRMSDLATYLEFPLEFWGKQVLADISQQAK